MTGLLRLIVVVPLAYVAAVIAAGFVVAYRLFGPGLDGEAIDFFAGSVIGVSLMAGAVSFVPALVAVVLAEAFAWRSAFTYLAIGGAIGFAADRLTDFVGLADFAGPAELAGHRPVLSLAAGFVGGFVYWLIAGRKAGS